MTPQLLRIGKRQGKVISGGMQITLAHTDAEIDECFPVMSQLRPALVEKEWLGTMGRLYQENFRLALLRDASGEIRCVAGFRIMHLLYSGKTLYVDDLVTHQSYRSLGYGDAMIDWLIEHARQQGCAVFSLDSGTQRVDAHRFYLRKRLHITCFHFALVLNPAKPD